MLHKGGAQKVMAANYLSKSRHGTVYFFKRRIPKQIHPQVKNILCITNKSVLTFSLRTSNLKEAKIRARWMAVQSDWLFEKLLKGDEMTITAIERDGISFNCGFQFEFDELSGALKKLSICTESKGYEGLHDRPQVVFETPPRLSMPTIGLGEPVGGKKLSEAIEEYLNGIDVKPASIRAYRAKLLHLKNYFGDNKGVLSIDQIALVEYSKRVKEGISNSNTANQYVKTASSFLNWVRIRSGESVLTTSTLTQKRAFAAYKDRDCFSMDQMRAMFAHAIKFRESCPAKYWVILVMAFTGARLEEVCQINLKQDLKQSDKGVWYFDFNQRPDEDGFNRKSLKKISTERVVAIHSALVERGLIDYLQIQLDNGFTRPFEGNWEPFVNPNGGDYKWNHYISKWGSKQLKLLKQSFGDETSRVTFFHSLRHTFSTVLANRGVSEELRSTIQGQRAGGGINGNTYTKIRLDPALSSKVLEEQLVDYVVMLDELETGQ